MKPKQPREVGTRVRKIPQRGGGSYVVVGRAICQRCKGEVEIREVETPSKKQEKKGYYFSPFTWCENCTLYSPRGQKVLLPGDPLEKVNRVEVIDYTTENSRVYNYWHEYRARDQRDIKVSMDVQDDGRTLKIFIGKLDPNG